MEILKFHNVSAYYLNKEQPVIRDVNITLREGEIVTILGPNGAGKSTVLKTVFGLSKVSSGQVQFQNADITNIPQAQIAKLGIGYVYQGRRLFPSLTVLENLEMGAYTRSDKDGIKQDIEQILELFGELKDMRDKQVSLLSGGEQQMVAFGRAMMLRPKMMLVDEPSIGLAPIVAERIFGEIRRISEAGIAVLMVEQNVEMALKTAQRAYLMREGRVVKEDLTENLKNQHELREIYFGGG